MHGSRRQRDQLPLIGRLQLRGEGGQATVEFALVLPLLLATVYAIFEFGTVFHNYLGLADAVRTGARVAIVSRSAPDPTAAATTAVVNAGSDLGLTSANVAVSSTWQPGTDVTVTATYPYTLSLFGFSVTSGNLTSSTTMRVE